MRFGFKSLDKDVSDFVRAGFAARGSRLTVDPVRLPPQLE